MTGILFEGFIEELEIIAIAGSGLLLYLFFHFFNHALLFGRLLRSLLPGLQIRDIGVLASKTGGFIWLGVVPVIIFVWLWPVVPVSWIRFACSPLMLKWSLILIPFMVFVAYAGSRAQKHQDQYPQVRERAWSLRLLVTDMICWALYLLGYEAFFRGFLLFGMAEYMNPWIVIIFNTVFYSLVHLPKGRGETLGAVPLGIILCFIALRTGNFWVPFFVHLSMAWSNEIFTLRHHRLIISPLTRKK